MTNSDFQHPDHPGNNEVKMASVFRQSVKFECDATKLDAGAMANISRIKGFIAGIVEQAGDDGPFTITVDEGEVVRVRAASDKPRIKKSAEQIAGMAEGRQETELPAEHAEPAAIYVRPPEPGETNAEFGTPHAHHGHRAAE